MMLFWVIFNSQQTKAQMNTLLDVNNTFVHSKAININNYCFIWWHCDSLLPCSLFTTHKNHTGLGVSESMAIERQSIVK
jgi:hypothetical protein